MPLHAPRSSRPKGSPSAPSMAPVEPTPRRDEPRASEQAPTRLRMGAAPAQASGLPKEAQALPQHAEMLACFDEALPLLEMTATKMLEGLTKAYDIANALEKGGDAAGARAYRGAAEEGLAFARNLSATFHQTKNIFSA